MGFNLHSHNYTFKTYHSNDNEKDIGEVERMEELKDKNKHVTFILYIFHAFKVTHVFFAQN